MIPDNIKNDIRNFLKKAGNNGASVNDIYDLLDNYHLANAITKRQIRSYLEHQTVRRSPWVYVSHIGRKCVYVYD